jgi:hypothetical protein
MTADRVRCLRLVLRIRAGSHAGIVSPQPC